MENVFDSRDPLSLWHWRVRARGLEVRIRQVTAVLDR